MHDCSISIYLKHVAKYINKVWYIAPAHPDIDIIHSMIFKLFKNRSLCDAVSYVSEIDSLSNDNISNQYKI